MSPTAVSGTEVYRHRPRAASHSAPCQQSVFDVHARVQYGSVCWPSVSHLPLWHCTVEVHSLPLSTQSTSGVGQLLAQRPSSWQLGASFSSSHWRTNGAK